MTTQKGATPEKPTVVQVMETADDRTHVLHLLNRRDFDSSVTVPGLLPWRKER